MTSSRSRTRTSQPARASSAAQASELIPLPTMTASGNGQDCHTELGVGFVLDDRLVGLERVGVRLDVGLVLDD